VGLVAPLAEERVVAQLPLAGLPGVAAAELARLRELNLTRLGQLRGWARGQLGALLPESGARLFAYCRGLDREAVDGAARPTRLEASHEWAVPEGAAACWQGELWALAEHLAQRLDERGLAAGRLELLACYGDGQAVQRQARLAAPTAAPSALGEAAAAALARLVQRRVALRGLRLAVLDFSAPGPLLAAALAAPAVGAERLGETVAGLRRRYGRAAIVTGPAIALLARPAGGGA
jgi:nucleotidyltransferase/DNA polymerase involved in DNA repair